MLNFCTRLRALFLISLLALLPSGVKSQEISPGESLFPIPEGLEKSVEFWKKVFTVYSTSELIFFDPLDPANIYTVVTVENEKDSRHLIKTEKQKIMLALGVDEDRIRVQRGIKDRFIEGLVRSGQYIEQMQQIFRDKRLPVELAYLPLVESSFNVHARSSAGAVGMWQFIRSTGKRFLRIDRHVDERKDPLESTRAAALFLNENYQLLGTWPLALTAYNHGPGGLARAVAQVGSRDLVELIRNYQSRTWGFASKNFYAEFLAALEVANNVEKYFPGLELHQPSSLEEIELAKATTMAALLRSTSVPRTQFLEWNPALHSGITVVPQGYRVKIFGKKVEPLLETPKEVADQAMTRHRVMRGETLSHIARRYEASVEGIRQANGLRAGYRINVGQELIIPTP